MTAAPTAELPTPAEHLPGAAPPGDFPDVPAGSPSGEPLASVISPRRIARSAVGQMGARVVHLGVNVVSTLAIVHYLSPADHGDYVVAQATVLLLGLVADYGLGKLAIRELAQSRIGLAEAMSTVAVLRAGLALGTSGIVQIALFALGADARVHAGAAIFCLTYFTEALFTAVTLVLHVQMRQEREALARVALEIVETIVLLVLIARNAPLPLLFAAPVVGGVVGVASAFMLASSILPRPERIRAATLKSFMREGLLIGPALFLGVMALRLDGLLLSALRTKTETGLYGAAYQIVEYLFLANAVLVGVGFPLAAAAWGVDPERFRRIYTEGSVMLVSLALAVPITAAFVAGDAVPAVLGRDYSGSASVLRVLSFALPLMILNGWHGLMLLCAGRQRLTLAYDAGAVAIALTVGPLLIRAHGTSGAASAALVVDGFVLLCSTVAVRSIGIRLGIRSLVRVATAAVALTALLAIGQALGLAWWALCGLACLHPVLMILLKTVQLDWLRHPERDGAADVGNDLVGAPS